MMRNLGNKMCSEWFHFIGEHWIHAYSFQFIRVLIEADAAQYDFFDFREKGQYLKYNFSMHAEFQNTSKSQQILQIFQIISNFFLQFYCLAQRE